MKALRLAKVMELIEKYEIYTQEDLLLRLREEGIETTQATISRDIKELNLVKGVTEDGKYKYVMTHKKSDSLDQKYHAVLVESLVSADYAGNTAVVRCHTGMANAACAALDRMGFEGIVGTLAGDDTIFVLMRDEKQAEALCRKMGQLITG